MTKQKIFISYTVRDGFINRTILTNLDRRLSKNYIPFIDLLHNNSTNPQQKIYEELLDTDILLLLETPEVYNSPWVNLELLIAKSCNKHIVVVKNITSRSTRTAFFSAALF